MTLILRLLSANFFLRAAASAMGVIIALYLARIAEVVRPVSALEVSLIVTISYTLVELPLSPLVGGWSDRWGSRRLLLLGPVLGALGVMLASLSTQTAFLVGARLLAGIGAVLTMPPLLKLLADASAHEEALRAKAVTFFEITALIGFIVGSAAGGFLFEALDVQAFWLLAVIYLLAVPIFWPHKLYRVSTRMTEEVVRVGQRWRVYLERLAEPLTAAFFTSWLLFNIIVGLWISQIAFQLAGPGHPPQRLPGAFSDAQVGLVFGGYGVAILLGLVIWMWLMPRVRRSTVMMAGAVGFMGTILALLGLNYAENPMVIALLLVVVTVSIMTESGFAPAALAFLSDLGDQRAGERGIWMGIYHMMLGAGQLIGGWLGGVVAGWAAIDGMVWATVVLSVLMGIAVWRVRVGEVELKSVVDR